MPSIQEVCLETQPDGRGEPSLRLRAFRNLLRLRMPDQNPGLINFLPSHTASSLQDGLGLFHGANGGVSQGKRRGGAPT